MEVYTWRVYNSHTGQYETTISSVEPTVAPSDDKGVNPLYTAIINTLPQNLKGDKGDPGSDCNCPNCFSYLFTTDETDLPPDTYLSTLNPADLNMALQFYLNVISLDGDISTFLQAIQNNTSTPKGAMKISLKSDPTQFVNYLINNISSGLFPPPDTRVIDVQYVNGSVITFAEDAELDVCFSITGNKGDKGDKGETGPQGNSGFLSCIKAESTYLPTDLVVLARCENGFTVTDFVDQYDPANWAITYDIENTLGNALSFFTGNTSLTMQQSGSNDNIKGQSFTYNINSFVTITPTVCTYISFDWAIDYDILFNNEQTVLLYQLGSTNVELVNINGITRIGSDSGSVTDLFIPAGTTFSFYKQLSLVEGATTSSNAIINNFLWRTYECTYFGVPNFNIKGDKGECCKGDKGNNGEKGMEGDSIKGDKGESGDKGIKGETGQQGISIKGDKGETGQQGNSIKGNKGETGQQGNSIKGDKGETDNTNPFISGRNWIFSNRRGSGSTNGLSLNLNSSNNATLCKFLTELGEQIVKFELFAYTSTAGRTLQIGISQGNITNGAETQVQLITGTPTTLTRTNAQTPQKFTFIPSTPITITFTWDAINLYLKTTGNGKIGLNVWQLIVYSL